MAFAVPLVKKDYQLYAIPQTPPRGSGFNSRNGSQNSLAFGGFGGGGRKRSISDPLLAYNRQNLRRGSNTSSRGSVSSSSNNSRGIQSGLSGGRRRMSAGVASGLSRFIHSSSSQSSQQSSQQQQQQQQKQLPNSLNLMNLNRRTQSSKNSTSSSSPNKSSSASSSSSDNHYHSQNSLHHQNSNNGKLSSPQRQQQLQLQQAKMQGAGKSAVNKSTVRQDDGERSPEKRDDSFQLQGRGNNGGKRGCGSGMLIDQSVYSILTAITEDDEAEEENEEEVAEEEEEEDDVSDSDETDQEELTRSSQSANDSVDAGGDPQTQQCTATKPPKKLSSAHLKQPPIDPLKNLDQETKHEVILQAKKSIVEDKVIRMSPESKRKWRNNFLKNLRAHLSRTARVMATAQPAN